MIIKLYVTKAGFSNGVNWLGYDKNIKEPGPCQGLFSRCQPYHLLSGAVRAMAGTEA
jgi:hypothetical protein